MQETEMSIGKLLVITEKLGKKLKLYKGHLLYFIQLGG